LLHAIIVIIAIHSAQRGVTAQAMIWKVNERFAKAFNRYKFYIQSYLLCVSTIILIITEIFPSDNRLLATTPTPRQTATAAQAATQQISRRSHPHHAHFSQSNDSRLCLPR